MSDGLHDYNKVMALFDNGPSTSLRAPATTPAGACDKIPADPIRAWNNALDAAARQAENVGLIHPHVVVDRATSEHIAGAIRGLKR